MVALCQTWMCRRLIWLGTLSSCTQSPPSKQLLTNGLQIAAADSSINKTLPLLMRPEKLLQDKGGKAAGVCSSSTK